MDQQALQELLTRPLPRGMRKHKPKMVDFVSLTSPVRTYLESRRILDYTTAKFLNHIDAVTGAHYSKSKMYYANIRNMFLILENMVMKLNTPQEIMSFVKENTHDPIVCASMVHQAFTNLELGQNEYDTVLKCVVILVIMSRDFALVSKGKQVGDSAFDFGESPTTIRKLVMIPSWINNSKYTTGDKTITDTRDRTSIALWSSRIVGFEERIFRIVKRLVSIIYNYYTKITTNTEMYTYQWPVDQEMIKEFKTVSAPMRMLFYFTEILTRHLILVMSPDAQTVTDFDVALALEIIPFPFKDILTK